MFPTTLIRSAFAVLAFVSNLALSGTACADYVNFEAGQVRPLALSADSTRLFALNTPDNRVEILDVTGAIPRRVDSVAVGLQPVAVAVRSEAEIWVVNQLSDSVSIIDLGHRPPRVVRTLLVGDEPQDIVFAGTPLRAFVTAAHRGQNLPFDPQLMTPGVGRADVWVFDPQDLGSSIGGTPVTILTLFADSPRALAVNSTGSRVYAAGFHSGNRTTLISQEAVCDGGADAAPCIVDGREMPGGLPAPNESSDGTPGPETGLIVRQFQSDGPWEDELGRDWSAAPRIALPDKDVFVIDADADPPVEVDSHTGVGTILYSMAVNPVNGDVYVANTEARNEVRFESRVRGHQHESRITVVRDGEVLPRHLNKHLDYESTAVGQTDREASLALPMGMAVSTDGGTLYLAAFGSGVVAVFDTATLSDGTFVPSRDDHITVSGGGPSGLALDGAAERLYVMTRFDNAVSAIDLAQRREIAHHQLHNPEPSEIVGGRRFLYDAAYTSENGEAACASCHVFGHFDSLAWDLGDPDAPIFDNPNPLLPDQPIELQMFHPLKGPMTTQTLRGIADAGPMHWRGDRTGGVDPGGDALDPRQAFKKFNIGFTGLLGRPRGLTDAEMEAFADFALQITPPPNPVRALDDSLTPEQQTAADIFLHRDTCTRCHTFDPANRHFGTSGMSVVNPNPGPRQIFKVPTLRGLYDKTGMFGIFPVPTFLPADFPRGFLGAQVRGFGFINDGSGILPPETAAFMLVFDTNLKPIVGQQITLVAGGGAEVGERINLLIRRADAGDCDLIAKANVAGRQRGWAYGDGVFHADRASDVPLLDEELRQLADSAGQELTFTCVPPGSGVRAGIDRDGDGSFDSDEIDALTDPADPSSAPGLPTPTPSSSPTMTPTSTPRVCTGDCDGDGRVTVDELLRGVSIVLGQLETTDCPAFDASGDGSVTVDEIVLAVNNALSGCGFESAT